MELIEFKSVNKNGSEYSIFINSDAIESIYTIPDSDRVGIALISGNQVEVNHTFKETTDKLNINIKSTDYKRTDLEH